MLRCVVLCYVVLYFIVCAVLYCVVLCCVVMCCVVLRCVVLCCVVCLCVHTVHVVMFPRIPVEAHLSTHVLFERIPRCFANKLDSFVLAGLGTCAFVATASLKYRKGCMPRPPTEILCGLSVRHVQSRRLPK